MKDPNKIFWMTLRVLVPILTISIFFVHSAESAYFTLTTDGTAQLDFNKRTHIIIDGIGGGLGTYPVMAARAKMDRIHKAYPGEQVVVFNPVVSQNERGTMERLGFKVLSFSSEKLVPQILMNELTKFRKVASLNTYGHSAITEGIFLDQIGTRDVRFYPGDLEYQRLTANFTDDAFAVLNGCNGGELLAPLLSKTWKVPVAGALTGSHFETIYQDNTYYWAENLSKSAWAAKNISELATHIRLRPDNANYNGHYGHYFQGLPFYKFFCADIHEEKCFEAMARSAKIIVSPLNLKHVVDNSSYGEVVREWLCPTGKYGDSTQSRCQATLKMIDLEIPNQTTQTLSYTPFLGKSFQCTFDSCYTDTKCLNLKNAAACAKTVYPYSLSTTFVDEYLAYMKGFKKLQLKEPDLF